MKPQADMFKEAVALLNQWITAEADDPAIVEVLSAVLALHLVTAENPEIATLFAVNFLHNALPELQKVTPEERAASFFLAFQARDANPPARTQGDIP